MRRRRPIIRQTTRLRTLISQGFRCRYCGVRVSEGWEVDHIFPVMRGGRNWRNLACSCRLCNRKKGTELWLPLPMKWWQTAVSVFLVLTIDQHYILDHLREQVSEVTRGML